MQLQKQYDVAIAGGGLAGLSCAIQLGRNGHSVLLFEKESYPFHKVCGEYVSLESWNYLQQLGVPLQDMNLPFINFLFLSAPDGKSLTAKLPLGGFGISRYKLDDELAKLARQNGVHILEETKVEQIIFKEQFEISFSSGRGERKSISAKLCCAAFGKRSNLDIKWKRAFLAQQDRRLDNYVGIKYHLQTNWQDNVIGLHNFKNGYCGISKIEEGKYCLCYMVKSESLQNCGNSIYQLEKTVLYRNPWLKKIFSEAEIFTTFPITISQISFQRKSQIENHILMLGDAAGMITPLCGNGMSIALHTGKIASQLISQYLSGKIDRAQLEKGYGAQWQHTFAKRLQAGRFLQKFFGNEKSSNFFVGLFRAVPFLAKPVIKMTHGKPF